MNTELLRKILDKARDDAPTPGEEDAVRVLMFDLGLASTPRQNDYFLTRHNPAVAREPRGRRK